MPEVKPKKRMYALHRWAGVFLAPPLLLIFLSGVVVIFVQELNSWANRAETFPGLRDIPGFSLDQAFQVAAREVPGELQREIQILQRTGGALKFTFKAPAKSRAETQIVELDPVSLSVRSAQTQPVGASRLRSGPPQQALSNFFVQLHFRLLAPGKLGFAITGVVGLLLLLLVITGIIVHRPTLKKLRRVPRTTRLVKFMGDFHALVGSWTLPFTAILAITGAFFSLAKVALIPVLGMAAFNGDRAAMMRVARPAEEVEDSTEIARLDPILKDALARNPGQPYFIMLQHWGQPQASATVRMYAHSTFEESTRMLAYDGHTGAFLREKPRFGTAPSLGVSALNLASELHFGTLFGMATKVIWALFGLAGYALIAAGLVIFVEHRRHRRNVARVMSAVVTLSVGGIPLSFACVAWAWALSCAAGLSDVWPAMQIAFWGALLASALLPQFTSRTNALGASLTLSGLLLIALPWVAPLAHGLGVLGAWRDPAARATLAVDLSLVLAGLLSVASALRLWRTDVSAKPARGAA